jgi:hypothetical protein
MTATRAQITRVMLSIQLGLVPDPPGPSSTALSTRPSRPVQNGSVGWPPFKTLWLFSTVMKDLVFKETTGSS